MLSEAKHPRSLPKELRGPFAALRMTDQLLCRFLDSVPAGPEPE